MAQAVGLDVGGAGLSVPVDDRLDITPADLEHPRDFLRRFAGLQVADDGINGLLCFFSQASPPGIRTSECCNYDP